MAGPFLKTSGLSSGLRRRPQTNGGGGSSLDGLIASMFGNGEKGFVHDYTDFSTMFQTADTSTPVDGENDPIHRINDLTPNNLHAIQATSARQPFLTFRTAQQRWGASYDASNWMDLISPLDLTDTDKVTVWLAVNKGPGTGARVWISHGGTASGSFEVFGPRSGGGADSAYSMSPRTNTAREAFWVDSDVDEIEDVCVITGTADLGAPRQTVSRNGLTPVVETGAMTARNFISANTMIGHRNQTIPARGTVHAMCVLGREATAQEILDMNLVMARKAGISI